jgi:hypothetical protein
MKRRKYFLFCLALMLCVSVEVAHAGDAPSEPLVHKAIFGVLLHDRGPFSDRNENGVDPN